jgi:glycerophosphoryl diester phosphodiesterase
MSRIDNGHTRSLDFSAVLTNMPISQRAGTSKLRARTQTAPAGKQPKSGTLPQGLQKSGVITPREIPPHEAPEPSQPVQEGVEVSYDILEKNTRFGVSVEYYDEAKKEWITVGAKDHGKGKGVTSQTGTEDGGSIFIPDQNGHPAKLRLSNTSEDVCSEGTGKQNADGTVTYTWVTKGRSTNDLFPSVGYFPSQKDTDDGKGNHTVTWHDGGGGGFPNGKTRDNITLNYGPATRPTKGYVAGTDGVSESAANATLYAANGNKPVTAERMNWYVERGIVKINKDGTWTLVPSAFKDADLRIVVINILSDDTMTYDQKMVVLDKLGLRKEARRAIDAKGGDNDGRLEVSDITKAMIIDAQGNTVPFDVQFRVSVGNDGSFIALSVKSGFNLGFAKDRPPQDTIGSKAFGDARLDPNAPASGTDIMAALKDQGYSFDPKGSGVNDKLGAYVLEGLTHGRLTAAALDGLIRRGVIRIDPKTKKMTIDKSKMTDADVAYIAAAVLVAPIPPTEKAALLAKLGISPADQKRLDAAMGDGDGVLEAEDFDDDAAGADTPDGSSGTETGAAPAAPGKNLLRTRTVIAVGLAAAGIYTMRGIFLNRGPSASLASVQPNIPDPRADINYAPSTAGGADPGESDLIVDAHLGRNAEKKDIPKLIADGVIVPVSLPDGTIGYRVVTGKFTNQELNAIIANILDGKDGNSRSADEDLARLGMSKRDVALLKTIHFGIGEAVSGSSVRGKGRKNMFDIGPDGKVTVNMGPKFARDRNSPNAIPQSESTWPKAKDPELPPGKSASEVYPKYTQPNVFENWKPGDKEIVPHRGQFDNGRGVPENSLGSIDAAVGVDPETGQHNSYTLEFDVVTTKDGKVVLSHDLGSDRSTTRGPKPISQMNADEIVGQPIVVREVKDGKFTGKYVVTNEPVITMETAIDYALQKNPDAVIIIDARTSDPEKVAAEISKLPPEKQKHVVIQTYPYNYASGQDFKDKVNKAGAKPGWEKTVQIVPVLPSPLTKDLARKKYHLPPHVEPTYEQRVAAGEEWMDSFDSAGIKVPANSIQIEGTGEFYDPKTDTIKGGFTPAELKDPKIKSDFRGDAANIEIYQRHRKKHPTRPVVNSYRSDDYKSNGSYYIYGFANGQPTKKPEGAAGQGSENRAVPGRLQKYGDVFITDRPREEKAALVDEEDGKTDLDHSRDFPAIDIQPAPG